MNNLLRGLAQKNNFNFAKVEPSQIPNDRFDIEKPLVQFVQETKKVNKGLRTVTYGDIGDRLTLISKSWSTHPEIFPKFQFSGS